MRKQAVALIALYFLVYIAQLGVRPLVVPDETRYGEIPREMLASGDWVVPRLDGMRYFEKPMMGHWLNAAAMVVFGENAFAVRFPSALAAGLTGLLLFLWARRYSDDQVVPWFAAAVFLLSIMVFGIGTFAVLDTMLSLFTTAAIVAFYRAYQEPGPGRRFILLLLAGAACGCAFLTKGFIALVIPVSVILPFALWQGWLPRCLRTCLAPVVGAVLVALPWSLMIHGREPDFWHYFFWVEHVNRFVSPSSGQHPAPLWYYVPVLLGGIMPWTALSGPIVQGLRQTGFQNPMLRLAVCWLVFPFLFFSACGGKLATYILPCFPPVAFLIAVGVVHYLRAGKVKGFVTGSWILVVLAGLLCAALVGGLIVMPPLTTSVPLWRWSALVLGLMAWGVLCRIAIAARTVESRLLLFSMAPLLVMLSLPHIIAAPLGASKLPGQFLLSRSSRIPPGGMIVSRTGLAASVCWYYRRTDVYLYGSKGEYDYGLGYPDSQDRFLNADGFRELLHQPAPGALVTWIVLTSDYDDNARFLPEPVFKEVRDDLVFAQFAVPTTAAARPQPVLRRPGSAEPGP